MKAVNKLFIWSIVLIALVLSACAGAAGNGVNQPPADVNAVNQPPTDDNTELPPAAAVKAREALAARLGIDVSAVKIVSQKQVEWSDSCLGLGGPAESCLQAVVPGWRVELFAQGQGFIARTDELGEVVRFEESAPLPPVGGPEDLTPEAAATARETLAAQLGAQMDSVIITEISQAEWSDSCLGLGGPAESCLQALVPGWRVVLSSGSRTYVARTDDTGTTVRFEGMQTLPLGGDLPPLAAFKAQEALAVKLGVGADTISIINSLPAEWPNGCLGLARMGEMCTEALVSGWQVELSAGGKNYIARTDDTGDVVRFEGMAE